MNPIKIDTVAGAGNKFLHLLQNKSDLYINLVPGLKYWDTCAGDALIKGRFGYFTDLKGSPIKYDHEDFDRTL
jgi:3'(2'), 5'-bisphosphate nucleotidase